MLTQNVCCVRIYRQSLTWSPGRRPTWLINLSCVRNWVTTDSVRLVSSGSATSVPKLWLVEVACDHAPVWARGAFRRRWGGLAGSAWGAAAAGGGVSDPETLVGTLSLYSVASAAVSLGDSRGNQVGDDVAGVRAAVPPAPVRWRHHCRDYCH